MQAERLTRNYAHGALHVLEVGTLAVMENSVQGE